MLLNVTMPVFNEQQLLEASIHRLAAFLDGAFAGDYEIVIADNGSTDATPGIGQRLATRLDGVRLLRLDQTGRGGALKAAWTASHAAILSYMDADLSSDLAAFPELIDSITSGRYDLAIGSRLLNAKTTSRGWKRELTSRVYVSLVKAVFRNRFSDPQCGFKAIRREAVLRLLPLVEDTGWFFDTELLVLAERDGWWIRDVPVAWKERKDSRVRLVPTIMNDLKGILTLRRRLAHLPLNGLEGKGKHDAIEPREYSKR